MALSPLTQPGPGPAGARTLRLAAASLAACVLAMAYLAMAAGPATAAPSVTLDAAQPAGFVPDWDGENSATMIPYTVHARSRVTINVRNASGLVVRVLLRDAVRAPGRYTAYWDGRSGGGSVVRSGSYRIQLVARRVSADGSGGVAGSATTASTGVAVRVPRVSIASMTLSRGTISRRSGMDRAVVRFRLSDTGTVAAAVVRADGSVVRNMYRGTRPAGYTSLVWTGTDDRGARVPDGAYQLVVSASAGRIPTRTLRATIRVDTTVPAFASLRRDIPATVSGRYLSMSIPVTTNEPVRLWVVVEGYNRVWRGVVPHVMTGRRSVPARTVLYRTQPGGEGAVRGGRYVMMVYGTDRAGNTQARRLVLTVPSQQAPLPPAPKPGGYLWPVQGTVTSEFGPRWGRMHEGIDIAAPSGTGIRSSRSGRVTYAGDYYGYGLTVKVDHGDGIETWYTHMSRIDVAMGDPVGQGEGLGLVGCTGSCTGPHVHYEIRVNGVPRNPRLYLPAS